jgi:hypothetical protein
MSPKRICRLFVVLMIAVVFGAGLVQAAPAALADSDPVVGSTKSLAWNVSSSFAAKLVAKSNYGLIYLDTALENNSSYKKFFPTTTNPNTATKEAQAIADTFDAIADFETNPNTDYYLGPFPTDGKVPVAFTLIENAAGYATDKVFARASTLLTVDGGVTVMAHEFSHIVLGPLNDCLDEGLARYVPNLYKSLSNPDEALHDPFGWLSWSAEFGPTHEYEVDGNPYTAEARPWLDLDGTGCNSVDNPGYTWGHETFTALIQHYWNTGGGGKLINQLVSDPRANTQEVYKAMADHWFTSRGQTPPADSFDLFFDDFMLHTFVDSGSTPASYARYWTWHERLVWGNGARALVDVGLDATVPLESGAVYRPDMKWIHKDAGSASIMITDHNTYRSGQYHNSYYLITSPTAIDSPRVWPYALLYPYQYSHGSVRTYARLEPGVAVDLPVDATYFAVVGVGHVQGVDATIAVFSSHDPRGAVDGAEARPGAVWVRGWAADNDAPNRPLQVKVCVGGKLEDPGVEVTVLTANATRTDIPGVYPQFGTDHGFNRVIPTSKTGSVPVYVYAVNTGAGADKLLAGRKVVINDPRGAIDSVCAAGSVCNAASPPVIGAGAVWVRGWAADDDAPAEKLQVRVVVEKPGDPDVEQTVLTAEGNRTDLARAYPVLGADHGYNKVITTTKSGRVLVSVYAVNAAGTGGNDKLLGTRAVVVSHDPHGAIDSVCAAGSACNAASPPVIGAGAVWVRGWAADYDAPAATLDVKVSIGGPLGSTNETATLKAIGNRTDLARAYPALGADHGYNKVITTTRRGQVPVYIYAVNAAGTGGADKLLGVRTVTVK